MYELTFMESEQYPYMILNEIFKESDSESYEDFQYQLFEADDNQCDKDCYTQNLLWKLNYTANETYPIEY